jgi:spermidine synthase
MDDMPSGHTPKQPIGLAIVFLFSVFVVATCGLVYELLASTLASYLLGDSVTQFSTVIGTYLFAMGIGSWISRYVTANEVRVFVSVEIVIAMIGGWSAAILFLLFPILDDFRIALYGLVLAIGMMVGLEIPLLIRILRHQYAFKDLVSTVLTYDYVGALVASILFPLVLVPFLGMIRTGFAFGFFNVLVAFALLLMLPDSKQFIRERIAAAIVAISLILGFFYAEKLQRFSEVAVYGEKIVYARSTPYQRIVMTRDGGDMRLFLNGNLQFSSRDEYRYHEALVWPALGRVAHPNHVLILGGGDGLAAREVLKEPKVKSVTLVDLDPEMTQLFRQTPMLKQLNAGSLSSNRVQVINADAFRWIRTSKKLYDVIIIDFPDPTEFSLGKLYTDIFYREVSRSLAPEGVAVVQSTSPLIAPKSYWTIAVTLEATGLHARGYHAYVPSFGEWGFTLAAHRPVTGNGRIPEGLRFLNDETVKSMFIFAPDMQRQPTEVNRLDNQSLVRSFAQEWGRYEN